jgi:hypothetical protein
MMRGANPSTILKGQRSNYKAKQMPTKLGKQPQKNNKKTSAAKQKSILHKTSDFVFCKERFEIDLGFWGFALLVVDGGERTPSVPSTETSPSPPRTMLDRLFFQFFF